MWNIKALQKWLLRVEREGATDVEGTVEGYHPLERIRLEAKSPSGVIVESVYID